MFGVTSMRISCVSINDESLASVIPPIYYKERINSRTFIIWTQKLLFLHTDWAINTSQPLKKRLNKSCIWYYSSYLLTTMTDDTFVNLMQFFLAKTVVLHHEINKRITHLPVLTTSINYERVAGHPVGSSFIIKGSTPQRTPQEELDADWVEKPTVSCLLSSRLHFPSE